MLGFNVENNNNFNFKDEEVIKLIELNNTSRFILFRDIFYLLKKTSPIYEIYLNDLQLYYKNKILTDEDFIILTILLYKAYKKGLKEKKEVKCYIYELLGLKDFLEVAINTSNIVIENKINGFKLFKEEAEEEASKKMTLKDIERAIAPMYKSQKENNEKRN